MKYWQFIHLKLKESKTVYAMTVIHHSGSSPGRQGFKMAVAEDGEIFGSIGGGVMEYNLVELCKELLNNKEYKTFLKHQNHKGSRNGGSGMICSGEQTVVFHALDMSFIPVIESILTSLKNNQRGTLSLTQNSFNFSQNIEDAKYQYSVTNEDDWFFNEQLGFKETLYIVGGGHVGLATSKLFVQLGFYVVIFDNRDHLNTFEQNSYAHKKHIIDYNAVAKYIPEGATNYVAIMTNKYTDDKLALTKLIKNNYKFIGVLGSKAKLKTMYEVMQNEGYTEDELASVHAPIGLSITSQTPEEIAVSIAAQIIEIKNKK